MRKFFAYFFQGLLYTAPATITVLILVRIFNWIYYKTLNLIPEEVLHGNMEFVIVFAGVILVIFTISVIGFIGSSVIIKPIFIFLESFIKKAPLIKTIYTSLKDVFSAFVGKKKKFDTPVVLKLNKDSEIYKVGFITRKNLEQLDFEPEQMVSVYCPHSYAFSGEMFIVPKSSLRLIDKPPSEVMKFIISGGVTEIHEIVEPKNNIS